VTDNALVTAGEFCREFDIHPRTERNRRQRGDCPRYVAVPAGQKVRIYYRRADIEAWITANSH